MKPMLAVQIEDVNTLKFPVYVSPKLDGVRALVIDGKLLSRSLKPFPNEHIQKLFAGLPEGTDGELIFGLPTAENACRKTVSAVMSEDGEPDVTYWVFDNFKVGGTFQERFRGTVLYTDGLNVKHVPHVLVNSLDELLDIEEQFLAQGYEGAMVRSVDGPYKQGRSTLREGYLLKLKRFLDAEGEVLDTFEYMHNDNEAKTNALGRTERSSHKENLRPGDMLGGFVLRVLNGDLAGTEVRCGTGLTMEDRKAFWPGRAKLVGAIVKFSYFPKGVKDKPRHPVFLGFRDVRDM